MKIYLIFTEADQPREVIIDLVVKSLNNLTFGYTITPKEWDMNSDNGTHPVDLIDLLKFTDLGMVLNDIVPEKHFQVYYTINKNLDKMHDTIVNEDLSNLIYINKDEGCMSVITYFEEQCSNDKEILEKQKRLKEIIYDVNLTLF